MGGGGKGKWCEVGGGPGGGKGPVVGGRGGGGLCFRSLLEFRGGWLGGLTSGGCVFAVAMADSCSLNCCCSRSKKSVGDSLELVSLGQGRKKIGHHNNHICLTKKDKV